MAKVTASKPSISGGRTLANMRHGKKGGGAKASHKKKGRWAESGGLRYPIETAGIGRVHAHLEGERPEHLVKSTSYVAASVKA